MIHVVGEGSFDWDGFQAFAEANDLSGESLTIFGPWLAGEGKSFENLVAYFDEATGANSSYVGSDSLEQQILIDAAAGSAPNLTVFPQPGLAANLAKQGYLTPLAEGRFTGTPGEVVAFADPAIRVIDDATASLVGTVRGASRFWRPLARWGSVPLVPSANGPVCHVRQRCHSCLRQHSRTMWLTPCGRWVAALCPTSSTYPARPRWPCSRPGR